MLSENLAKALLERRVLARGVLAKIEYTYVDPAHIEHIKIDNFVIDSVSQVRDKNTDERFIAFLVIHPITKSQYVVKCEDILEIDNMTIEVITKAYDLNAEGGNASEGKAKRGRPRKHKLFAKIDYPKRKNTEDDNIIEDSKVA